MNPLDSAETRHLEAAKGWLELGNPDEAEVELGMITLDHQRHADVLDVRFQLCAARNNWEAALTIAAALVVGYPGQRQLFIYGNDNYNLPVAQG